MAPSSAVVGTLRRVTDTKLAKLSLLQQNVAQDRKKLAEKLEQDPDEAERVRTLVKEAYAQLPSIPSRIVNVERFLDQRKHDPSVTDDMLAKWRQELTRMLDWKSRRQDHTALFSKLVTEWIEHPNDADTTIGTVDDGDESDDSTESSTTFEPIGREEMHKQRRQWEEYAFSTRSSNKAAIFKYLDSLFHPPAQPNDKKKPPVERMRDSFANWRTTSNLTIGGAPEVKRCIKAVLRADLFAGEKRQALEDLVHQPAVLGEISDVLNADLASLDQWEWNPSPIGLTMRRQLNGKYRVYMDEDIYQAILLQHIGIHVAVMLKKAFVKFFSSSAWLQVPHKTMPRRSALRREYFLGAEENAKKNSIREKRRNAFKESYFLTQLPSSESEGNRDYGADESDGDSDAGTDDDAQAETPLQMKQKILYLVTSESLLSQEIYGEFTVLQSDFKWFGPGMPHSTILSVLEYFRFPEKWLRFFQKFLTPKLYFTHDGKQAEARQRSRGLPMAHTLSDALGEAVMFCLDYAVNQRTNGGALYRFHDDLWYWGVSESCETMWKALQEFSKVMGLEINEEKTGTVTIVKNNGDKAAPTPPGLPKGDVRWGFLVLDSAQGRWVIDQKQVDEHIVELRCQLSACRSVFAYVQAFNAYVARFMINNFGWPAFCLGRAHVDMCIATIEYIQKELFGANGGTIVAHLRQVIKDRFGVTDLPDAFFYFPNKLCALGVSNPMVSLLLKRPRAPQDPAADLRVSLADEEQYELAKSNFAKGNIKSPNSMAQRVVEPDEEFMSLEEFNAFIEHRHVMASLAYDMLQEATLSDQLHRTQEIAGAPSYSLLNTSARESPHGSGSQLTGPQLVWILELYGREALDVCGDVQLGEREMLPLGLLGMLQAERVRWQG